MRPHPMLTTIGKRTLVQFATQLRTQYSFSTAATRFNVSNDAPSTTTQQTVETPVTASNVTDVAASKITDLSSIHYLLQEGVINKPVHSALERLGYHKLTPVQEKSIQSVLSTDADFIMKAKTGTGKTLAFGIPLIEQALKAKHFQGVVGVVVAPTRDLAFQIRDELEKVVRYKEVQKHTKNLLRVQTLVGGEKRYDQLNAFKGRRQPIPSIVVATPGRLADMIREPEVMEAFAELECIVLDEADRLLGEGFKEDLVEITETLKEIRSRNTSPRNDTPLKTMLYSATLDDEIMSFSKKILRPDFKFIDTVDKNAPETHEKIEQSLVLTGDIFESYVAATLFIEKEAQRVKNFKAIIFLPTIKSVTYFYEVMNNRLRNNHTRLPTYQLHGQLTQSTRDRSVKQFRKAFSGVLVASDVGARGMDFPNVTNVIQIGLPMDSTNYVHRVGRTARGGKTGDAVMILTKGESRFIRILKNRGLTIASQFEYEKSEEDEAQIAELSQECNHKYTLDLVIESLAGFSKGVAGSYKLNMYEMLEELSGAYGKFNSDPEKRPHVTLSFATRVLGLNRRDAQGFFDLGGSGSPSREPRSNDGDEPRQSRFFPRDDRNDRNDNRSRGPSRDRGYSNDRYDDKKNFSRDRRSSGPTRFNDRRDKRDGGFGQKRDRFNGSSDRMGKFNKD